MLRDLLMTNIVEYINEMNFSNSSLKMQRFIAIFILFPNKILFPNERVFTPFSLKKPKEFYKQIVTFIFVFLKNSVNKSKIRKQNENMLFVLFQIHDDLEKEPEYSGSGFGPDDEDSSSSSSSHQRKKGKQMK